MSKNFFARSRAVLGMAVMTLVLLSRSATAQTAPPAPTGLTATQDSTHFAVKLKWQGSTGANYKVYRAISPTDTSTNLQFIQVGGTHDTSFVDNWPIAGKRHSYRVTAFNQSGQSQPSNTVQITPVAPPPPPVPSAPTNLTARLDTLAPFSCYPTVRLTWHGSAGANYKVYRAAAASDTATLTYIPVGQSRDTAFTDVHPAAGKKNYYKVTAFNQGGESSPSNTVFVTVPAPTPTIAAPHHLTARRDSLNPAAARLKWDAVTAATGYKVFKAIARFDSSFGFTQIVTLSGTTYLDAAVDTSSSYLYYVKAFNATSESRPSNLAFFRRPHSTTGGPIAPSNVVINTAAGQVAANVQWGGLTGISNYKVYRIWNDVNDEDVYYASQKALTATSMIDTQVRGDMPYNYSIVAANATGNGLASDLAQWNFNGILSAGNGSPAAAPTGYRLEQNYPNPFNPTTVISYQLPVSSQITLKVYNLLGQEVATLVSGQVAAGTYRVSLNASNLASGVYLYRLQTEGFSETRKMLLVK